MAGRHAALKGLSRAFRVSASQSRTETLRNKLAEPGILLGPCCHDGISARLIERSGGFGFAFMSGFCASAARLGAPDTGLMSYAEMVDQGRNIHEATRHLPIIGDGDTGYGNGVNVKRTVRGYSAAGFAGILIEDQAWPKSCGHVRNKKVVGRGEAVTRIRAACDARDEGSDIVIVARTDARQAESLDEALWRAAAFADAGADVVFVDALASEGEMQRFCREVQGAYKMANMLEGGGKTPILPPAALEEMGFKLCAYPLSLLAVSVRAMEVALGELRAGRVPEPPAMPTFAELQEAVGFPEYFAEEERYTVLPSGDARAGSFEAAAAPPPREQRAQVVEADSVVEPGDEEAGASPPSSSSSSSSRSPTGTIDLAVTGEQRPYGGGGERTPKWLRIKISDAVQGTVKLETRFPAGFLSGVAAFVPQVAGMDLEGVLRGAKGGDWDASRPLLAEELAGGDRVEVFVEF